MSDIEQRIVLVASPTVRALCIYFDGKGWTIEMDRKGAIKAVMPSGYGSGPADIDLIELGHFINNVAALR